MQLPSWVLSYRVIYPLGQIKKKMFLNFNQETQEIIDWLECEEDSFPSYLDKNADELCEFFDDILFDVLRPNSIRDLAINLIRLSLKEKVDWQYVLGYINSRQEKAKFEQYVTDNFESAGASYYLSKNPEDYRHYQLPIIRELYIAQNSA